MASAEPKALRSTIQVPLMSTEALQASVRTNSVTPAAKNLRMAVNRLPIPSERFRGRSKRAPPMEDFRFVDAVGVRIVPAIDLLVAEAFLGVRAGHLQPGHPV